MVKYKGVDVLEGDEWVGKMNMLKKDVKKMLDEHEKSVLAKI